MDRSRNPVSIAFSRVFTWLSDTISSHQWLFNQTSQIFFLLLLTTRNKYRCLLLNVRNRRREFKNYLQVSILNDIEMSFDGNTYTQTTSFQCRFHTRASVCQFFGNNTTSQHIQFQTTAMLWNMAIQQTNRVGFLNNFPRIFAGFIMVRCIWNNFFACKFPCNLLELFLFVAQVERYVTRCCDALDFGQSAD